MSVVLHKYGADLGLPDISPFCIKLETYLRMAEIPFTTKPGDPFREAPKGKLPYIKHDGEVLADSSFIIRHLKSAFGDVLDEGMTSEEKATTRAFQSMIEEHLYFILLYYRWQDPAGWRDYKPVVGSIMAKGGVPAFMRPIALYFARKGVIKSLHGQGTGRHSLDELLSMGMELLDALSDFLGEKTYLFGDAPRTLDAILFAFVGAMVIPELDSPLKTYALTKQNLVDYCHRIKERYYADLG